MFILDLIIICIVNYAIWKLYCHRSDIYLKKRYVNLLIPQHICIITSLLTDIVQSAYIYLHHDQQTPLGHKKNILNITLTKEYFMDHVYDTISFSYFFFCVCKILYFLDLQYHFIMQFVLF